MNNHERHGILVLGMHRSGTSALTGTLAALGIGAPKTPIDGDQWNSRGYWESSRVNHFNERLLSRAGSSWDDWLPFDIGRLTAEEKSRFLFESTALLSSEFGSENSFAVKDPRICRIVPFWLEAMRTFGVSPSAILALRHPVEVALSLQRRDQMQHMDSIMLWMRSILDGEHHSRDLERTFMQYEDLLSDWRSTVNRIGADLSISWPNLTDQATDRIENFLSRSLKHNTSRSLQELDLPDALSKSVAEVWEIVCRLANDISHQESYYMRLDSIRDEFDAFCLDVRGKQKEASPLPVKPPSSSNTPQKRGFRSSGILEKIKNHRRYWAIRCLLLAAPLFSVAYAERIQRRLERYEAQGKTRRKTFS